MEVRPGELSTKLKIVESQIKEESKDITEKEESKTEEVN